MQIEKCVTPFISDNCYILIPEGQKKALVVDPGYGAIAQIKKILSDNAVEVGAVLCTHGHPDHIWDAADIAGENPVYIPAPDAYRLDTPFSGEHEMIDKMRAALPEWKKPANVVALNGDILTTAVELIPELPVRMVPAPGHTEGSSLFFFNGLDLTGECGKSIIRTVPQSSIEGTENEHLPILLALTGDVIFKGSVGRTDLPGGDAKAMLHTLRTLQNVVNPDTVLLPGHGSLTTFGAEKMQNPHFAQARFQG